MYYLGARNPMTIIVMMLMLVVAIFAAKVWLDAQPDAIGEELTTAEIISVEEKQMSYYSRTAGTKITNNIGVAKLLLDSGKTFTSTVKQPYPSPGEKVPVRLVRFSDGTAKAAALSPQ